MVFGVPQENPQDRLQFPCAILDVSPFVSGHMDFRIDLGGIYPHPFSFEEVVPPGLLHRESVKRIYFIQRRRLFCYPITCARSDRDRQARFR